MLTEDEWERVSPHLANAVTQIKQYREEHQCSLSEAHAKGFGQQALAAYEQITGFKETNPNALFHRRLYLWPSLPRLRQATSNATSSVLRHV